MLNLNELQLNSLSTSQARILDAPFSREEVKKVVMEMPSDRAPGPAGFSGLFFKFCWEIIGDDLLAALEHIHKGHFYNFQQLNSFFFFEVCSTPPF
jgi:hypothetical protein